LKHTLAKYVYSHCNIYNIQDKTYGTPETHTPVRSSMPTVTRHGSSKWCIQMRARAPLTNSQGWSFSLSDHRALSGHTEHARASRAACIPRRASDHTCSQALTRGKDRCGPCLTAIACTSFSWLSHCVGRGPFGRMTSSTKHYRTKR
jgi:hypothetical protein